MNEKQTADGYTPGLISVAAHLPNLFDTGGHDGRAFRMQPHRGEEECSCGKQDQQWGWEDANPHSAGCFQALLKKRLETLGVGVYTSEADETAEALARELNLESSKFGTLCTCDFDQRYAAAADSLACTGDCDTRRPNFVHHQSGLKIQWYKRIGRATEVLAGGVTEREWLAIVAECLLEIAEPPQTAKQ